MTFIGLPAMSLSFWLPTQASKQLSYSLDMAQLDAKEVSDRLEGENRDLWVHIEADTPLEKYPGRLHFLTALELRLI
jgi:hypothetical protein